jgi:putative phage-type endonuclease
MSAFFRKVVHGSRNTWLKYRHRGITGSDVIAILGEDQYKTRGQLLKEKQCPFLPEPKEENKYMLYGKEAESHLINLFKLDFPNYQVTVPKKYETIEMADDPFIRGTVDGYLLEDKLKRGKTVRVVKRKLGILEIKTVGLNQSRLTDNWRKTGIPKRYYYQVLHYMLVTNAEFAVLKAQFENKDPYKDKVMVTRHYIIDRDKETAKDINRIYNEEIKFIEELKK